MLQCWTFKDLKTSLKIFFPHIWDLNLLEANLQECARVVTEWYDSNGLKGNYKKYGSMIISRAGKSAMSIKVKDYSIEPEHNISLLGVNIDSKLSFTDHISAICKRSSQRVGVLMRLRNLIPTRAKLQPFKVAMLPHLTYCSTVILTRIYRKISATRGKSLLNTVSTPLRILSKKGLF